jgi:hypothetical protein
MGVRAVEPREIGHQVRWQKLDRDVAAERRVVGAKDLAHAAFADQRIEAIRADVRADDRRHPRDWPIERAGVEMGGEQRRHLLTQAGVVAAPLVEKRVARHGVARERRLKHLGDLPPAFGRHRNPR